VFILELVSINQTIQKREAATAATATAEAARALAPTASGALVPPGVDGLAVFFQSSFHEATSKVSPIV